MPPEHDAASKAVIPPHPRSHTLIASGARRTRSWSGAQARRHVCEPSAWCASRAGSPSGMVFLARMVKLAGTLVVGVIVVGILCHVLGANASNGIVSAIYDVDKVLVGPFHGLFSLDNPKVEIAVNWGLAAVVYAIATALIVRLLLAAAAAEGFGWRRRRAF